MTGSQLARGLAATGVAGLLLAGCGSSSHPSSSQSAAPVAPGGQPVRVLIKGYAYAPPTLTVKAGTRLEFINRDATAHTATASAGGLDTGSIKPGGTATVTVTRPGTFSYICQFHPFMHGTIRVT